jgi:hypothetical protein
MILISYKDEEMFPTLLNSKRFKKDFKNWKSKIDSLKDTELKSRGQKLLSQYMNYARQIDAGHDVSYSRDVNPEKLREAVISLQTFRERIERFVKDIDS